MSLFKAQYRIQSARLTNWDYTHGWYFITICTAHRHHSLGRIVKTNNILSKAGTIVAEEWQHTAIVRPYVRLGAWVVMPNHFHAIIGINVPDAEAVQTACSNVDIQKPTQLISGSLGAIIGQFKSVSTKRIRSEKGYTTFAWQTRFYDVIIHDEPTMQKVQAYINTNPERWVEP